MSQTAIITGAGSGVGRACALKLSEAGWRVGLVGRRRDALQETADRAAGETLVLPADIARPEAVDGVFAAVKDAWGRLDLLFNNAGRGSPAKTIDETSLEDWYGVLDANLNGSVLCARAAFAMMRAQEPQGGRIVNNGSISAYVPRPGSVPYSVTKHAITGLTRCLALDGRPYDIACGQIDIGNAATEMTDRMVAGVPQADLTIKAEPRMPAEDVASSLLHMASLPLSSNVLFMTVMATKMPFVGRG